MEVRGVKEEGQASEGMGQGHMTGQRSNTGKVLMEHLPSIYIASDKAISGTQKKLMFLKSVRCFFAAIKCLMVAGG